jgi:hypothetical protein
MSRREGTAPWSPAARRPMTWLAAGLALAALPLLSGCLILPAFTSARVGALLPEDGLAALRAGTPRRQVLDGLGPPTAVVRRGTGAVRVPEASLRTSGSEEVGEAFFFDRFADQPASPDDVVYFYRAHQLTTVGSGVVVIVLDKGGLSGRSRDEHREDRLWVLLDGATGLMRAHVLERDVPPVPVESPSPASADATSGGGAPP